MLEKLIAHYCGPALAGIKPSNIATCRKDDVLDVYAEIDRLNKLLNRKSIYIDILREKNEQVLIMVYRKDKLEKHLQDAELKSFLKSYGYTVENDISEYIDFLKGRLSSGSFPHEIGVFLGYPLHDIYGFINHRDEGCVYIGEWKVYHDLDNAKKLFARYKSCRKALVRRIEKGYSLAQIFCAA